MSTVTATILSMMSIWSLTAYPTVRLQEPLIAKMYIPVEKSMVHHTSLVIEIWTHDLLVSAVVLEFDPHYTRSRAPVKSNRKLPHGTEFFLIANFPTTHDWFERFVDDCVNIPMGEYAALYNGSPYDLVTDMKAALMKANNCRDYVLTCVRLAQQRGMMVNMDEVHRALHFAIDQNLETVYAITSVIRNVFSSYKTVAAFTIIFDAAAWYVGECARERLELPPRNQCK